MGEGRGLRRLVLRRGFAVFPPRRGQRAAGRPLSRHRRPARGVRSDQPARAEQGVRPGGAGGGPALQPGLQRRAPGGLRPLSGDPAGRQALQRRRGLPPAGHAGWQRDRRDRRAGDPAADRARPGGRGRVRPRRGRRPRDRARRAGGRGRERCDRLAPAPAAVRDRASGRAAGGRDRPGARSARGRQEPPGPHRRLRDQRARRAAQPGPPYPAAPDALGRAAVRAVRQWPGDLEPRRGRRLLVRRPRPALARPPMPLPAGRRPRGGRAAARRLRLHAQLLPSAPEEPRQRPPPERRPQGPPGDRPQLLGRALRLRDVAARLRARPRDHGAARLPPLRQARAPAGGRGQDAPGARGLCAPLRQDRLPPGRQLQDGRRCARGGRSRAPGARHRPAANCRIPRSCRG